MNVTPFLRFYRIIGKGDYFRSGHIPDDSTLWECLTILEQYYSREVLLLRKSKDPVYRDVLAPKFGQHLFKIRNALKSDDPEEKIRVIDKAIQQWHKEIPVLHHLAGKDEDKFADPEDPGLIALRKEWDEILDILTALGMSDSSPYE